MKKLIIRIGLGVIGLVLIVLLILYFRLNGIVKRTVEQQATNSLNLQTEVGGAQLSLFGGSLSLDEIQIASPQGFAAPFMLRLEEGDVKVKYGQLRQDPIRITSLVLDEPRLVIEQTNGKFNFSALTELSSRDTQDPMKLIIDDLQIKDATVVLRPGLPGLQNELKVPIPSLTLKNVGTGDGAENGAAVKQVVLEVITAMAAEAQKSGLPDQLQAAMRQNLDEVAQKLGGELNKRITDLTGKLDPALGKEVENRLGNLLGGAKEEPKSDEKPRRERK